MAFPQYETMPLVANATASNSLTIDLPASVSTGNLLLVFIACFDSTRATEPAGWSRAYFQNDPGCAVNILQKVADGTESGTQITVPLDATVTSVVQVTQVAQWGGALSDLEFSAGSAATSSTANPPALTPSWGAADTLWMAFCSAADDAGTFTGFPADYIDPKSAVADAGANVSCSFATATRNLNAATEDPGGFTLSETEYWVSGVLAIEPGTSGNLSSTPTINNVDGDNAVNQYQQAIVDVSGFTETITTATLGGVACTIPENDPADSQITVGMPGTGLATGTYDLVISGATETDTITGISYTVTHEFTAPFEPVDSNSLFAGQLLTSDSYHRIVTPPTNGTLDTATAEAQSLWGNDVDDIYTPNEGFTGDDTVTLEILYSDGTTAQWTATITVEAPDTVGPVVQSVSVPTAGTYTPGQTLNFTVNWDEAATVTGTPALNLDIGGSARQANYASGTGTTALVFTYTVQTGDEDTDGITVSSLTLDGGTIKDSAGNDADLTLNAVGDTSGILVDGVSPVISINDLTTTNTAPIVSGSAGDAASLTLTVTGVGTYNITPDSGTWQQQLPTLALGDYPMTLNGEDAAGNAAVERNAVLSIVEEIVTEQGGLFRALFTPAARSVNKSLFR